MHSVYTRNSVLENLILNMLSLKLHLEYRVQSNCEVAKNAPIYSFNPSKISQLRSCIYAMILCEISKIKQHKPSFQ